MHGPDVSRRRASPLLCIVPALILSPSLVLSQNEPENGAEEAKAEDRAPIEEVIVTGSRIKRQDFSSISPIVTLEREDVTLAGITALEDLLNDAPQLVPTFDRTGNNPGRNAAELSLRGLGANRTLLTLNGRRLAPYSVFGTVDVNTIPARLVERVEIVTGGASTVYGSDAVAGVVNFIVDTDFEGFEVTTQYDTFEAGDGEVLDASVLAGGGGDRWHLTGFVNWQDRQPVFTADRRISEVIREEYQPPFFPPPFGELGPSGSPTTGAGVGIGILAGGVQVPFTFGEDGAPRFFQIPDDLYNFQERNYLQTPLERLALGLFGDVALAGRLRLFGELLASKVATDSLLAPAPSGASLRLMNFDHPLLTAEQRAWLAIADLNPASTGIAEFIFGRRFLETGPRVRAADTDSLRMVVGLDGQWLDDWDWELTFSHSESDRDTTFRGGVFASRFAQSLLADPVTGQCFDPGNGCVPVNPFGLGSITDEALAFLETGPILDTESVEERILSFNTTGELLELPAGALAMAAGLEFRDLASRFSPDPNFVGGGVLGYLSNSPVDGAQEVGEVYAEFLAPLLSDAPFADYLGLEAGYRYSDYEFSGGVDNWKIGADWSPAPRLRFRVMAQRAIRAPNIDELFRTPVISERTQPLAADGCVAENDPVGNGWLDLCVAQGIPAERVGQQPVAGLFAPDLILAAGGGSTELAPEEADTLTAGVVWQPAAWDPFSLSVDYYRIEIDNAIGGTSLDNALALCFEDNDPDSPFCRSIVRGPDFYLAEYTNPQFNLARRVAEGVDLALATSFDLGSGWALDGASATLYLRVLFNHAIESSTQVTALAPTIDCVGFYGGECRGLIPTTPEHRAITQAIYRSGPFSAALRWQWIDALDNHLDITCELGLPACLDGITGQPLLSNLGSTGARDYFDLSARYAFGDHVEVYGGVSNLFEKEPPQLGAGQVQSNTAPALYDVFGRRWFAGITYRR